MTRRWAIVLATWVAMSGGCLFQCEDRQLFAENSASRQWRAELIERDCGATTRVSQLVLIRRVQFGWLVSPKVVFVVEQPDTVRVHWVGKELQIQWTGGRVFKRETAAGSVPVSYQATN